MVFLLLQIWTSLRPSVPKAALVCVLLVLFPARLQEVVLVEVFGIQDLAQLLHQSNLLLPQPQNMVGDVVLEGVQSRGIELDGPCHGDGDIAEQQGHPRLQPAGLHALIEVLQFCPCKGFHAPIVPLVFIVLGGDIADEFERISANGPAEFLPAVLNGGEGNSLRGRLGRIIVAQRRRIGSEGVELFHLLYNRYITPNLIVLGLNLHQDIYIFHHGQARALHSGRGRPRTAHTLEYQGSAARHQREELGRQLLVSRLRINQTSLPYLREGSCSCRTALLHPGGWGSSYLEKPREQAEEAPCGPGKVSSNLGAVRWEEAGAEARRGGDPGLRAASSHLRVSDTKYNLIQMAEKVQQSRFVNDFFVRRADLDDTEALNSLITEENKAQLDVLFDYPKLVTLFERSFASLVVLSSDHKVVGAACFDDCLPGLRGQADDRHYNLWEEWIGKAFNLEGLPINSCNSLWLTYLFVSDDYADQIEVITERILQNLYILLPQLDGVLFMKRGEVQAIEDYESAYRVIHGHFLQLKPANREVLKGLVGISTKSRMYFTPKSHVVEDMEIRMAREEDHDDLAEIFNKQSDVLTSQFGEFFIADLIATQNLTRRMTKGSVSEGKAIVGQVGDKAIGLMSISTEIDYKLLNQYFDLSTFDNLLKSELTSAINARYDKHRHDERVRKAQGDAEIKKLIQQEMVKTLKIGQRIILQQFCQEKESEIKLELENIANNEAMYKALDIPGFETLLKRWTTGYQIYYPSDIFNKYPEYAKELESIVMSPWEFLIETLEIFGLPKHYMKKEGHWKDWAKKIIEDNIAAALRRPKKTTKKPTAKKGKDKRDEQSLKPPEWFDTAPFIQAFTRFINCGAEVRAVFREQLRDKNKSIVMIFCDKDGQMIQDKSVDLNALGKRMTDEGLSISPQVNDNMCSILQAFGDIVYEQRVVKMQEKVEEKKNIAIKKEVDPKFIDVTQRLVSFKDFDSAIRRIEHFDINLSRLGYIKSQKLDSQVKQLEQKEQVEKTKWMAANARQFSYGPYEQLVSSLKDGELPEIPYQATNAIVINLFCIDEVYEARSLDFVEFAFSLFSDRDYIIITQPFTVPENSLVKNFIQVPRKKNSTFEHCLYIFHKDSLFFKQLSIRRSAMQDISQVEPLLSQALNRSQIQTDIRDSILNPSSKHLSYTVKCAGETIGIYTISKKVNLDYYISHFFVQDQIIVDEHPRDRHAKVVYSFINPLFTKNVRFILREIMRLANKTCLYFEVHNRTLLPDIFNEFTPLRMRVFPHFLKKKWNFQFGLEDRQRHLANKGAVDAGRDPYDEEQAPFSLSMLSKKQLVSSKTENNTRIVVVGASDTGLSFIESLLMIKQVNFTNITLLAPGGLATMHVKAQKDYLRAASTNYSLEELRNLMIDARITVLDAKMVKLDKKAKKILIDKNAFIPFDILVLSVGLIDTLLQTEGLISYGLANSPYYKDKNYIKGIYSIDDPYLYQQFSPESDNVRLLKRVKKPQNITIYGRTPHTIAFISGLIGRGVAPQRIYYVSPGSNRRRTQTFESNQERIDYQAQLINDPDTFEDINVEKIVIDHLRTIGVHVELGFEFYQINGNPCQGVRFRKKADNFEELEELIKKKRAEIAIKLQEMGNKMTEQIEQDSEQLEQKISPEKEIELLQQQQWKQLYTPCAFFITSGPIDIDREIFNIIHENGLVYNGRLITKSNFQTTENEIFACGRICEFSQRYKNFSIGRSLRLDRYNGRELGSILSKQVLEVLNLGYLTTEKYTEEELPRLHMPVGMGSALFGDMVYYYIKRTDNSLPKAVLDKGVRSEQVLSKNIKDFKGHYIKFSIDPNGMIEYVSYLGSENVVVPSLASFVGLSIQYLNKVCKRNDNGLIPDIVEFLSENWAICLYHELFSEFRHYMKKLMSSNPVAERFNNRAAERASEGGYCDSSFMKAIKDLLPADIVKEVREGSIEFIKLNKNHLPMYYTPKIK